MVKSLDDTAQTVELGDEAIDSFPDSMQKGDMLGGYEPNDQVTIVWDMTGTAKDAQAIDRDKGLPKNGKSRERFAFGIHFGHELRSFRPA